VIAVLKQSALGTASYDTVKDNLKQTMTTVTEATKQQSFAQEIASLSSTQAQLRQVENKVIQLINEDKWENASDILFGDDYSLTTKTYEVDSDAAIGAVLGQLSTTAQRFARIKEGALGMRILALFLLLWVGIMFTHHTRVTLAEQMRLRDELFETYQEVEARVVERTAELEKTTQHLAVENEEREKSDQRTRLILNSAGDGIFGVDAQERGIFFNAAAGRLLGYNATDMLGKEIYRVIHHQRADGSLLPERECPMHLACAQGREKHTSGEVLWRQDGTSFLSEYAVTPITDDQGNNSGAVVVFRDITEQRTYQQELQQRMDELQRFNRLTMGREERMIALKQEVNALRQAQGLTKKYRNIDKSDPLQMTTEFSEGGAL
jgi:PAS domain S-box-containing protein